MLKERRYDIDWLRVIAMLAVFVYHCTRFFDPVGWHIKNDAQSTVLIVLTTGLFWTWMMPLFFFWPEWEPGMRCNPGRAGNIWANGSNAFCCRSIPWGCC